MPLIVAEALEDRWYGNKNSAIRRMVHRRQSTYARAALLFFVVAFLTFMSISAFPAFVEDMKVRPRVLTHVLVRRELSCLRGTGAMVPSTLID